MTATTYDRDAVQALHGRPVDAFEKGFGGSPATSGRTPRQIADAAITLHDGDFVFPVMALRESALARDIDALARFCADTGVEHAPHAKTSMAPAIFGRQIDAGAWGLTAATIGQVQVYRRFGVGRVLLANELVDPAAIRWVAGERDRDPAFDFFCYVDSAAGVEILRRELTGRSMRPLDVLVELGHNGGRTGVRSDSAAGALADLVRATPALRLAGVSAYEGGVGAGRGADVLTGVRALADRVVDVARAVAPGDGGVFVVSAGGSGYPDVVAERLTRARDIATVVLRSGSYVTHDHGLFASLSPFTGPASPYHLSGALELWAHVLSRPERALALLSAGRRDAPFDSGLPIPLVVRTHDGRTTPATAMTVVALNDQHAYLSVPPESDLAVGAAVCMGISHPCTAFDKWRYLPVVDDDDRVLDVVRTYF